MRVTDLTLALDLEVEHVKREFRDRVSRFNNSEEEYVCQHLADYFNERLNAIRSEREDTL